MRRASSEALRITAVFAAVVTATGLLAGIGSFLLMQRAAEEILRGRLAQEFEHRAALIAHELEERLGAGAATAARPEMGYLVAQAARDPAAAVKLQTMLASALEFEFISLTLLDAAGRQIAQVGAPASAPPLKVALPGRAGVQLAWNAGFEVESELPIVDGGRSLGLLRLRQPLKQMAPPTPPGTRTAAALGYCAVRGTVIHCFPGTGLPRPRERRAEELTPQMLRALAGDSGVLRGPDFRGMDVVAAYGPLPALGVGMSLRVETGALYAALRPQLFWLSGLLALLAGAVFFLLRGYVAPLLRRLARGEEQLRLALQGSQLALWEYDVAAGSLYLSEQWNVMLGGEPRPTRTSLAALAEAVHAEDVPAVSACIRQVLKGELAHYDIEHRVRRHDGAWAWIRSRGEVAERDARGRALRVIGTNAEITKRKESELATHRQAMHDALTGLGNRRYLDETLARELARAQRSGGRVALIMADADRFKRLNDTLGHDAGDFVLRALGALLRQSIRRSDVACRYGGEEFVLLLPEASAQGALQRAEAIRAAVKGLRLSHLGRPLGPITVSLGVALYPDDAADADGLLRAADAALYRAKKGGRDRVCTAAETEVA